MAGVGAVVVAFPELAAYDGGQVVEAAPEQAPAVSS